MSKVIDKSIEVYKKWCAELGIYTAKDINRAVQTGGIVELINLCEIWHEQNISNIAALIAGHIGKKQLVLIAGPSSSGKTSFANRLKLHLKVLGIRSKTLSMDDYFYDKSDVDPKDLDYTSFDYIEAMDYVLFNQHVAAILEGETVSTPRFDFPTRRQIPNAKEISLESDEALIVEGIHALNEKISDRVDDARKYKIYCTALTSISRDDGERISSRDTRLIRRLIRDCYFRNSSPDLTFRMWQDVEKAAQVNIYPYTDSADIVFNSSVLYEFCVYKKHLDKFLQKNPPSDIYQPYLDKIDAIVREFLSIDDSMVPHTSFLREFIGGSSLF